MGTKFYLTKLELKILELSRVLTPSTGVPVFESVLNYSSSLAKSAAYHRNPVCIGRTNSLLTMPFAT